MKPANKEVRLDNVQVDVIGFLVSGKFASEIEGGFKSLEKCLDLRLR